MKKKAYLKRKCKQLIVKQVLDKQQPTITSTQKRWSCCGGMLPGVKSCVRCFLFFWVVLWCGRGLSGIGRENPLACGDRNACVIRWIFSSARCVGVTVRLHSVVSLHLPLPANFLQGLVPVRSLQKLDFHKLLRSFSPSFRPHSLQTLLSVCLVSTVWRIL